MVQIIAQICRFWLGLSFLGFGLDGIFHFLPSPNVSERMKQMGEKLLEMKFVLPTVKGLEIISGIFLLFNFVPYLALIFLLPIIFGIVCLQMIFNREKGIGITLFIATPYLMLLLTQLPQIYHLLYFQNL